MAEEGEHFNCLIFPVEFSLELIVSRYGSSREWITFHFTRDPWQDKKLVVVGLISSRKHCARLAG